MLMFVITKLLSSRVDKKQSLFFLASSRTAQEVKEKRGQPTAGFVWVMENPESHGISYFDFQAWKVMEFK